MIFLSQSGMAIILCVDGSQQAWRGCPGAVSSQASFRVP